MKTNQRLLTLAVMMAFAVGSCGKHQLPAKPEPTAQTDPTKQAASTDGGAKDKGKDTKDDKGTPAEPHKGPLDLTPLSSAAKFSGIFAKDQSDDALAKKLADINPRFKTIASDAEEFLAAWGDTDGKNLKIPKGNIVLRLVKGTGDGKISTIPADATKAPVVKVNETAVAFELSADKRELVSKDDISIALSSPTQAVTIVLTANDVYKKPIKTDFPPAVLLKTQDGPIKQIILDGNNEKFSDQEILAESTYKGEDENDPKKPVCDLRADGIGEIKPIWLNGVFDLQKTDEALDFSKVNANKLANITVEGVSPLAVVCVVGQVKDSPNTILWTYTTGYTLKVTPKKVEAKK